MKARIVAAIVLIWTFAPAADALEWEVRASIAVRMIPRPEPQEARVVATGFHRLTITQFSVIDARFPIRFRILPGEIHENGIWRASCLTPWTWASGTLSVYCSTKATVDPCESAVWDADTLGILQGHPGGGYEYGITGPEFVDCECT